MRRITIQSDKTIMQSPWISLVERTVDCGPGAEAQVYHCVAQADYVSVLPVTHDGRIAIVCQYRPAVAAFTWEFPAGTVAAGETPSECAIRELAEEAGLRTTNLHPMGAFWSDTGRLMNRMHSFLAEVAGEAPIIEAERDMTAKFVTLEELANLIRDGTFSAQMQISLLMLALSRPQTARFLSWGKAFPWLAE